MHAVRNVKSHYQSLDNERYNHSLC